MSAKNEEIKKSVKEVLGRFQKTFIVDEPFYFVRENEKELKDDGLLRLKDDIGSYLKEQDTFVIEISPLLTHSNLWMKGERNVTLAIAVFWIGHDGSSGAIAGMIESR